MQPEEPTVEHRHNERRKGWQTQQEVMDATNKRLDDGSERMARIELTVAEVKAVLEAAQQATEDYRQKTDDGIREVHDRLAVSEQQAESHRGRIEAKLDANTATTLKTAADNTEILDILTLGKSFFRLAGYFGTFAKWAVGLASAGFAVYYMFVHGKPPP